MTNPNEALLSLADRAEQAAGPDRELDCLIWCTLNGVTDITYPSEPQEFSTSGRVEGRDADGKWILLGWIDPGQVQRNWSSYGGDDRYPNVTASLDAAMTLIEADCVWGVGNSDDPGPHVFRATVMPPKGTFTAYAATPALALTAAALKALSHGERG